MQHLAKIAIILFAAGILLPASQAQQPDPKPAPKSSDQATSGAANLAIDPDWLLADPIKENKDLQFLIERREWLAQQQGNAEAFEQVAKEFEAKQAWYPAVEILYFAEKFASDPARREAMAKQMKALMAKGELLNGEVDAAVQLYGAGKRRQALEELQRIRQEHPYCEKAHFQVGRYYLDRALALNSGEPGKKQAPLAPADRAKVFQLCYQGFLATLAIDPLYQDAHYQLNVLRDLMFDQQPVLLRTDYLTQRSLDFMNGVPPAMDAIDNGDRSPEALMKLGDALAAVEINDYAIYAWQAAKAQAGDKKEIVSAAEKKISEKLKK